jgi:hypothetical protein
MGVAHEIGAPLTGLSDHLHRVRKDALGLAAIAVWVVVGLFR